MKKQIFATLTLLAVLAALTPMTFAQGTQAITQIRIRVVTSNRPSAGTSDFVYLGLGGREFRLQDQDLTFDDFATGSDHTYVFGMGSNVIPADLNNPRDPQLTTDDLQAFPIYIRKSEDTQSLIQSNWDVEEVTVTIVAGNQQIVYSALEGPAHLWLTNDAGLILSLKRKR
jgi:hypothetical protein